MTSWDPDELDEPVELLVSVLEDPDRGKEHLPHIVGLFESDDRRVRLSAAWACSSRSTASASACSAEIRRLSDRLDGEYVPPELTTTLDYISTRYADQVERILAEIDAAETGRGDIPLPRVGNFTRSNYYRVSRREPPILVGGWSRQPPKR